MERVKRLAGNEIELGIEISMIESRASNILMTKVWHPSSEQPVYHVLLVQRPCLLATHNILVQKTTALLMLADHSSYYNMWRGQAAHTVQLNNMYII